MADEKLSSKGQPISAPSEQTLEELNSTRLGGGDLIVFGNRITAPRFPKKSAPKLSSPTVTEKDDGAVGFEAAPVGPASTCKNTTKEAQQVEEEQIENDAPESNTIDVIQFEDGLKTYIQEVSEKPFGQKGIINHLLDAFKDKVPEANLDSIRKFASDKLKDDFGRYKPPFPPTRYSHHDFKVGDIGLCPTAHPLLDANSLSVVDTDAAGPFCVKIRPHVITHKLSEFALAHEFESAGGGGATKKPHGIQDRCMYVYMELDTPIYDSKRDPLYVSLDSLENDSWRPYDGSHVDTLNWSKIHYDSNWIPLGRLDDDSIDYIHKCEKEDWAKLQEIQGDVSKIQEAITRRQNEKDFKKPKLKQKSSFQPRKRSLSSRISYAPTFNDTVAGSVATCFTKRFKPNQSLNGGRSTKSYRT